MNAEYGLIVHIEDVPMVICLRCGWCCRNISPLVCGNEDRDVPEPCPMLESIGTVAHCKIYENRPKQCRDEHMGVGEDEYCPIGLIAMSNGDVDRPTGKCMYCGGFCYNGTHFCSEKCEVKFVKSIE